MIQIADKNFKASMQLMEDWDSLILINSLKFVKRENDVKSCFGGLPDLRFSISYNVLREVSKIGISKTNLLMEEDV